MHGLLISAIVMNGIVEGVILQHPPSLLLAALRLVIVVLLLICALQPRAIRVHQVILPTVLVGAALLIHMADVQIR